MLAKRHLLVGWFDVQRSSDQRQMLEADRGDDLHLRFMRRCTHRRGRLVFATVPPGFSCLLKILEASVQNILGADRGKRQKGLLQSCSPPTHMCVCPFLCSVLRLLLRMNSHSPTFSGERGSLFKVVADLSERGRGREGG